MYLLSTPQYRMYLPYAVMLGSACLAAILLVPFSSAQSANAPSAAQASTASRGAHRSRAHAHAAAKKIEVAQPPQPPAPPAPPPPDWPVNAKPNPASVVWDSAGLRINASNSSLQQILNEVSTETGAKVEGPVPDQRVYGDYGPGQARDVLSQLLVGSGFNVLLAGDLGHGAPREIFLSPRRGGSSNQQNNANRPQQDPDDEIPEQPEPPEEPPQQFVQPPPPQPEQQQPQQMQNNFRPGFGPNGPIRTPQQVMEEMQQRQLQQQQQMQQQQDQQNQTAPQANPQDQ